METLFRLDGQVAVVTGAANGVGAATARVLALQGARVAAVDFDERSLGNVVEQIGDAARAYVVDITKVEDGQKMVASVAAEFGRLDILVNVAGICPRLPFA